MTAPYSPAGPDGSPGAPFGAYAGPPAPSKEACTNAMLAHLLAIFTGVVGPLILYLAKQDQDEFVRFHALQAVYFELVGIAFSILTCGIGGIVVLVLNIIACTKANRGEWYEYPLAGKWARR